MVWRIQLLFYGRSCASWRWLSANISITVPSHPWFPLSLPFFWAEPLVCPNCNAQKSFEVVHNRCRFSDKQMVKLQETPDKVRQTAAKAKETRGEVGILIQCARRDLLIVCNGVSQQVPDGQTPQTVLAVAFNQLVDAVSSSPLAFLEITARSLVVIVSILFYLFRPQVQPGDLVEVTAIYRATPLRINPRQRTVSYCCVRTDLAWSLSALRAVQSHFAIASDSSPR